ncbi:hypothetical protein ACFU6S_06440 [Streptomyces sp. NPDC057456]|uniref:hypothetical protein n=1 Tax=Streptomyces sp. NPDC057456 TaxID=3346139 RepID=UPI0036A8B0D8
MASSCVSVKQVVTVIAASAPDVRLGCCDDHGPAVWVRVTAWSPRLAFLTDARPFMEVSGKAAEDLAGLRFFSLLGIDGPPAECLEWPDLGLCPPLAPREDDTEQAAR